MAGPCWKVGYDSKAAARAGMRDATKRVGVIRSGETSVYKCAFCGKYHWGRKRPALKG